MKKFLSLLLLTMLVLNFAACAENITKKDDAVPGASDGSDGNEKTENAYIVLEVTDSSLIVADIGQDGKAVEGSQYSVSNLFSPQIQITVGDKIEIEHNGQIMESFPSQFSKIYKMRYRNPETGKTVEVIVD